MDPFIGQIQTFAFNFPPVGWQSCNGQIIAISQNTALFSLLGTTYGGNGINTFALPNLQGREMIHPGTGAGLSPISWGEVSGAFSATMALNNMPSHTHQVSVGVNSNSGEEAAPTNKIAGSPNEFKAGAPSANSFLGGVNQQTIGQSIPFDITNPYLGLNTCIAMQGIYPARN